MQCPTYTMRLFLKASCVTKMKKMKKIVPIASSIGSYCANASERVSAFARGNLLTSPPDVTRILVFGGERRSKSEADDITAAHPSVSTRPTSRPNKHETDADRCFPRLPIPNRVGTVQCDKLRKAELPHRYRGHCQCANPSSSRKLE